MDYLDPIRVMNGISEGADIGWDKAHFLRSVPFMDLPLRIHTIQGLFYPERGTLFDI